MTANEAMHTPPTGCPKCGQRVGRWSKRTVYVRSLWHCWWIGKQRRPRRCKRGEHLHVMWECHACEWRDVHYAPVFDAREAPWP